MNIRILLATAGAFAALSTAAAAQNGPVTSTGSAQATASATIVAPSSVAASRNLAFGTIAKPSQGTSTVTVASAVAGGASPTINGGNAYFTSSGQAQSAQFHLTGTGNQWYYIDAPTLSFPTAGTNLGTPTTTAPILGSNPATTLTAGVGNSVQLPSNGVDDIYIGGTITLTPSTAVATYNGTLTLNVNFQ
jgi:hypothetical protein